MSMLNNYESKHYPRFHVANKQVKTFLARRFFFYCDWNITLETIGEKGLNWLTLMSINWRLLLQNEEIIQNFV